MTITKDETFGYELTSQGKLEFFSHVLDDFESYIETYWTKTQSEKWDDVGVLPVSFRIDYIEKQFEDDFEDELSRICEEDDEKYYDESHVHCFTVKNTPENLQALEEEMVYSCEVDEDDDSLINVQELAQWSWMYYSRKYYSEKIKEDMSDNTGIPIEDFQKEDISVDG